MADAYVIHGQGKDKCPANSLCLFADVNFNVGSSKNTILVVPVGGTVKFADHRFDKDGVGSIVNNTAGWSVIGTTANPRGERLFVSQGEEIPDLGARQLPSDFSKTWLNNCQSVQSFAHLPFPPYVDQPLPYAVVNDFRQRLSGSASPNNSKVSLFSGWDDAGTSGLKLIESVGVVDGRWSYTPSSDWPEGETILAIVDEVRRTQYQFYVAKPLGKIPSVAITSPKDGGFMATTGSVDGTAGNASSVELSEGSGRIATVPVAGGKWTYRNPDGWSAGRHVVTAVAIQGSERSAAARVTFTAETKNLNVSYTFSRSWHVQDGDAQGWEYSYDIRMTAASTDVAKWRLGFDHLPDGASLAHEFVNNFWGQVIEDGSQGRVVLGSPATGGHDVAPHKDLHIQVQVIYPDQDAGHEKLYGLFAENLSSIF